VLVLASCATRPVAPPPPTAVGTPPRPSAEPQPDSPSTPAAAPGTRELVAELVQAEREPDPTRRWHETRRLLAAMRALADPRGADALAGYVANARGFPGEPERVHRRTLAAFALAELGDLRALDALGARLELDPLEVYREEDPNHAELRRSDQERIIAARLIADLATLHPTEHERVRRATQEPLRRWIAAAPAPHANGLRALARMQIQEDALSKQLRDWADPAGALPKPGALPPFEEKWVIAQSALRYTGALRDAKSWAILEKQLARKPKAFDASMDSLISGGAAMLGMTVRALAAGAASGFAEWGDARATPLLLKHIDDDRQNEESRLQACHALGRVLDTKGEKEIVARLGKWKAAKDAATQFRLGCVLHALRVHPTAAATPLLLELAAGSDASLVGNAARTLGYAELGADTERMLIARLSDARARHAAAVALLLGGSAGGAERALNATPESEVEGLREAYARGLDASVLDGSRLGTLLRWVRNARALATREPGRFATQQLAKQLGELEYDTGPGSLTRVVLRRRLLELARAGTPDERAGAVDTLELLGERGVLLALAEGSDTLGERAARAAAALRPPQP